MWQHHFEFLLLGYGAYATFVELCKTNLPDIPDQHIAQMVAGIDVLLFKPDAELRRLARLAIETGVDGAFVEGRTPAEIEAELAPERGRARLAGRARAGQGPVVQHGHRRRPVPLLPQLARRSEHPLRGADRPHERAARRRADRPADRGDRARARAAGRRSTARCSTRRRAGRGTTCWPCRGRCSPTSRSTSSSATTGSLTRWWNKVREFGALLARHGFLEDGEDVFQLSRHEVAIGAGRADAHLGHRRVAARAQALAADRRPAQADARAAGRLDAAAGARRHARGDHRPDDDHAVGRHHRPGARVGPPAGRRARAQRRRRPRRAWSRGRRGWCGR